VANYQLQLPVAYVVIGNCYKPDAKITDQEIVIVAITG